MPTPTRDVMQTSSLLRRTFLIDVARLAAAGVLALELPLLEACARDSASHDSPLLNLTEPEGRTLHAFARQIVPSEKGRPGADEAGAVTFVDRAFGMPFFVDRVPAMRRGLAELDTRAKAAGARNGFASLANAGQITLLREIQETPFFTVARALVVIGVLADPKYGGNRGEVGWSLVGYDHRPSHSPPFGWYDTPEAEPVA
jgi:gluconate 2-dehydrogenase gamma chain